MRENFPPVSSLRGGRKGVEQVKDRRGFFSLFLPQPAQQGEQSSGAAAAVQYAMVVDLRRCVGCQACTVACAMENGVPAGAHRTSVSDYELVLSGRARKAVLPRLCNHCRDAACVRACPTGATYKRPDGIVVVDAEVCVGCGYCVQNCPYDARFLNRVTRVADKCTFCVHRVEAGLLPACVETCVGKARVFGNLADPSSKVAALLGEYPAATLKPEMGTSPRVYYIGLSGELQSAVRGEPLAGTPYRAEHQAEHQEDAI